MFNQFLSDLRQFMPSERIYTDELRTLGWGTDASFYRQIPKVVLRSDGEEEISKIVRLCQKYKYWVSKQRQLPLSPCHTCSLMLENHLGQGLKIRCLHNL